jgi:hypothetical protein
LKAAVLRKMKHRSGVNISTAKQFLKEYGVDCLAMGK